MDSTARTREKSQAVLIADGDDRNVRHLEHQLRNAGVANPILRFRDAPRLESFLQRTVSEMNGPAPCVLFFDPRMPGAHGYDPVRWIRRQPALRDLKIVIFSSTNHPEEIEGAGELGVHLFLKKHPDLSSLTSIVTHLCGVQPERQPWTTFRGAAATDS